MDAPFQAKALKLLEAQRKKSKKKSSAILDRIHEKWFFKLEPKYFVQLQKEWNEVNLKIVLENKNDYDEWLNYFKTMSPNKIKMLAATGLDILPTEAYAALSMWHDIIGNLHRINKIHQSGLSKHQKDKNAKTISQKAQENDRIGVLRAIRDQIAEKLEKGAGARDTASLAREMTEIMTQIADYEKRQGPAKSTKLGSLLGDMPNIKKKRPGKNGGGARNTSFRSRVTIEDVDK